MSSELGMLHMQAGRLEEARRQATHALALDPNYSVSRQLSALLAERAGRLDEAESEFRSCAGDVRTTPVLPRWPGSPSGLRAGKQMRLSKSPIASQRLSRRHSCLPQWYSWECMIKNARFPL